MFKPFKPPLLKPVPKPTEIDLTIAESDCEDEAYEHRPAKKRRLIHVVDDTPPAPKATISTAALAPRKPLLIVKNITDTSSGDRVSGDGHEGYYTVLWYMGIKLN
jgi:DNA repair and recombination protein RAD54B